MTSQDVWQITPLFGGLGLILLIQLLFAFQNTDFQRAARPFGLASAFFWGVLVIVLIANFLERYYQRLYPAQLHWLASLDVLLHGAVGLGLWWLARRVPGPATLWFVLLGSVFGIVERIFGIYGLCILDKEPFLQGLASPPTMVFSFCEYMLYWALVAWLACGLVKAGDLIKVRWVRITERWRQRTRQLTVLEQFRQKTLEAIPQGQPANWVGEAAVIAVWLTAAAVVTWAVVWAFTN